MSITKHLGKLAAGAALSSLGPLGTAIGTVANEFLSNDDKVVETTTIKDLDDKISKLPPNEQAKIMAVLIEHKEAIHINDNYTLLERIRVIEDSNNKGMSNRPKIALIMTGLIFIVTVILAGAMLYNVVDTGKLPNWELVGIVLALPTWVIKQQFHADVQDHGLNVSAAAGRQVDLPLGPLSTLAKGFLDTKKRN